VRGGHECRLIMMNEVVGDQSDRDDSGITLSGRLCLVATHDALFTSDLLVSDPAGDVRLGLDRKNSFVDRTLGGWGVLPSTYFDPESAGDSAIASER
jgi:hypothetical protein